jgi:hypothetical protein
MLRGRALHRYVMLASVVSRHRNHSQRVLCYRLCGIPIQVGEATVQTQRGKEKANRYHAAYDERNLH